MIITCFVCLTGLVFLYFNLLIVINFPTNLMHVFFIGLNSNHKGYMLVCTHLEKIYIFRNVLFNEQYFPYKHTPNLFEPHSSFTETSIFICLLL